MNKDIKRSVGSIPDLNFEEDRFSYFKFFEGLYGSKIEVSDKINIKLDKDILDNMDKINLDEAAVLINDLLRNKYLM